LSKSKKVLAIIGSPRRLGNCEIMAKEISRNVPEPHELELLRLNDFKILPCRGCYHCLFKTGACVLEDDFQRVIDAIKGADALMVIAPAYFLGPNACLKRLLDRGLAMYAHADGLWGKPAVGVGIAGIVGREGYTLLGVESFLKLLLADLKQSQMIYGALPGEIFLDERNKQAAAAMGAALFGPAAPRAEPACPLCGGQTFRFLGADRVRCMLCSNAGTLSLAGGAIRFDIVSGAHEMILSREDALIHKEWLVGMKSRFMLEKDKLKAISTVYRKQGRWVTPGREDGKS
jgi:multimeric flavodoxin WrbA